MGRRKDEPRTETGRNRRAHEDADSRDRIDAARSPEGRALLLAHAAALGFTQRCAREQGQGR